MHLMTRQRSAGPEAERATSGPMARAFAAFLLATALVVAACSSAATPATSTPPLAAPTATVAPPPASPAPATPASPTPSPTLSPTATPVPTAAPVRRAIPIPQPPKVDTLEIVGRLKFKQPSPAAPLSPRFSDNPLGQIEKFTVLDLDNRRPFTVEAVLRRVTPHLYFYVQSGQAIGDDELARAATEVEERIIPAEKRLSNPAWEPGASVDSRLTILHARIPGVAGYSNSTDLLPKAVNHLSNERPMVYINLDVVRPGTPTYYAVLTHELQHAAQSQADPVEETWLQEGGSEYAAQAAGYPTSLFLEYYKRPDTQLTAWPEDPAATLPHYGAAHLFLRYMADRYGAETVRDILSSPLHGIQSIDEALKARGLSDRFDTVFVDWAAATYLDQMKQGPVLSVGGSTQVALTTTLDAPTTYAGTVHQYGANYIRIRSQATPVELRFQGATTAPLLPAMPGSSGLFWWSNRGDSIDSTLTRRFDLTTVKSATLRFSLWYDIEKQFDFAYVEASRDGKTWDILRGKNSTEDDPLDQSFGPAYTGKSGGATPQWVDETIDLGPYAGGPVWLRFEYNTDQGTNNDGLVLDDLAIPEIGFSDNAGIGGGWDARGFVRTNDIVPQCYALRLITSGPDAKVLDVPMDEANRGSIKLEAGRDAVLVVTALAPVTTMVAGYTLSLTPAS